MGVNNLFLEKVLFRNTLVSATGGGSPTQISNLFMCFLKIESSLFSKFYIY